MKDFLELAEKYGLEGEAASVWAKLHKEHCRTKSEGVARLCVDAADVILDQHKQIEQLAAMTTI